MTDYLWLNVTQGTRRALSARSGFSVQRLEGFSLPDKDHLSVRGPQQHGATYVDTLYRPRRCSLVLMVMGCDGDEFQAKHRELATVMNPLDEGQLRIEAESGVRYTLNCRPAGPFTVRRLNAQVAELLVPLVADDPFFYTAMDRTIYFSVISTGLRIPFTIPAVISSPTNQASFTVSNDGDAPVYPIITLRAGVGEAVNPTFINDTTGDSLTVSERIDGLETLTVDMGQRTAIVTDSGGAETNVLGSVSGTFWDLPRGDNAIRIISEGQLFSGSFTFSERFLAAV